MSKNTLESSPARTVLRRHVAEIEKALADYLETDARCVQLDRMAQSLDKRLKRAARRHHDACTRLKGLMRQAGLEPPPKECNDDGPVLVVGGYALHVSGPEHFHIRPVAKIVDEA